MSVSKSFPKPTDPLAAELWELWNKNQSPDIKEFLARAGKISGTTLLALLRVDQHFHWRGGRIVPVEYYIQLLPRLKTSRILPDLIFDEIALRQERGERLDLDEYRRRFPSRAREIFERAKRENLVDDRAWEGTLTLYARDMSATTLPQKPSLWEPVAPPVIAGYEILSELGRGGMGVVYRARQTRLRRLVAIKMIRALELTDAQDLARFQIEAEAIAQLRHPNIVQVYEIGSHGERPFFSLEYVGGGSLAEHLRASLPPPAKAAAIVHALADAMQVAHQKGIIHRDLKPANILMAWPLGSDEGDLIDPDVDPWTLTPKIGDFGLAKQMHEESSRTTSGMVVGSPSYMPPEQARGDHALIGPRSDVYSLGAILYELLTGRPPFRAATAIETILQVGTEEPVPPTQLQPKLPRDLETICLKCLQKDPDKRYQSCKSLAADLRRFLDGEPIAARPVGSLELALRWCGRNRTVAGLAAGLLLVGVAGLLTVTTLYLRANQQRQLAQDNEARARQEQRKANISLAVSANNMGLLMYSSGQYSEALAAYQQAITLRRRLAMDNPHVAEHPRELAVALNNMANLLKDVGQYAQAAPAYDEAIALLEQQVRLNPPGWETRRALAACLNNQANLYTEQGRFDDGEKTLRRALQLQEQLARDYSAEVRLAYELGNSYANLGMLFTDRGEPEIALPWFDRGIERLLYVVQENRSLAAPRQFLSLAYANRARANVKLKRYGDALRDWDLALPHSDPEKRGRFLAERAQTLARGGDRTKAEAELLRLQERQNLDGVTLYEMARAAALCAGSDGDKFSNLALDCLVQAAGEGYFRDKRKVALLKEEADFAPLRSRASFQELMESLGK